MTSRLDYLRDLYRPCAEQLARGMPDIGDGLQTQLVELSRDPTPERCEVVAANLTGARRAVMQLCDALRRDISGGGA